jgi:hypothetical protein
LLAGTITSAGVGYLIAGSGSYHVPVIVIGFLLLLGSSVSWLIKVEK